MWMYTCENDINRKLYTINVSKCISKHSERFYALSSILIKKIRINLNTKFPNCKCFQLFFRLAKTSYKVKN